MVLRAEREELSLWGDRWHTHGLVRNVTCGGLAARVWPDGQRGSHRCARINAQVPAGLVRSLAVMGWVSVRTRNRGDCIVTASINSPLRRGAAHHGRVGRGRWKNDRGLTCVTSKYANKFVFFLIVFFLGLCPRPGGAIEATRWPPPRKRSWPWGALGLPLPIVGLLGARLRVGIP